jgi:hypothetical protein
MTTITAINPLALLTLHSSLIPLPLSNDADILSARAALDLLPPTKSAVIHRELLRSEESVGSNR